MTISGYSSVIVDVMLGWLKGLANWVLRLFNLAGSVTASPLLWLSQNWMKLLIVFLTLGIVLDGLIWLVRWRPHWVWFRKERVIVNDDRFFNSVDMDKAPNRERDLDENWDEHDYVVASTVVKRQERARAESGKGERSPSRASNPQRPARRRSNATKVERHVERRSAPREDSHGSARRDRARDEAVAARSRRPEKGEGAQDSIFAVKLNKPDVSDFYEDEVFNVSNLPASSEYEERRKGKDRASAS